MKYSVGYTAAVFVDEGRSDWDGSHSRPVAYSCWYPVSADAVDTESLSTGSEKTLLFRQQRVAENAALSDQKTKWPMVLLSHGTGGSAMGMAWLASRLAQDGYICVGVSHHGNTAIEPYRAEGFLCWWERASDLSFVIDHLDQIPAIKNRVNLNEISVAGFSLGGHTALALVGAITSTQQFEGWLKANPNPMGGPKEFPNLDQEITRLLANSEIFRQSWNRQSDVFLDPRISKCVAIAPAPPVRAFTAQSLLKIRCPTFIVAGEADLEAPFDECALWLSKQNSAFRLKSLGQHVGHYVFIAECTQHGMDVEPEICIDHPSVVRSEVHAEVAAMIVRFLASDSLLESQLV